MVLMLDPLANALSVIKNAESTGKRECTIDPASKIIGNVLKVMQDEGYVGEFEFVDNGKAGMLKVTSNRKDQQVRCREAAVLGRQDGNGKVGEEIPPRQELRHADPDHVAGRHVPLRRGEAGIGGEIFAYVY